MSHPSEFFIRYTMAQSWGDEDAEVTQASLNDSLKAFGLLGMLEEQYDHLMATFTAPDGFRFNNRKHKLTRDFMKLEKIHSLWSPGKDEKRVLGEMIHEHKLLKQDIHILLLGMLPHDVVADKINSKYRVNPIITEKMISVYQHYFWNVKRTSHSDWENLLAGKSYKDSFLASLYCGEHQALYRAGFNPRVDSNRAMKEAYRQAFFRIEALRYQPDSGATVSAFSKLSARLMSVHDVLYSQGTGLQDQLKEFRQLMMQHKDPDVKAIDTIIDKVEGGTYSGDGEVDSGDFKGDLQ